MISPLLAEFRTLNFQGDGFPKTKALLNCAAGEKVKKKILHFSWRLKMDIIMFRYVFISSPITGLMLQVARMPPVGPIILAPLQPEGPSLLTFPPCLRCNCLVGREDA